MKAFDIEEHLKNVWNFSARIYDKSLSIEWSFS